MAYFNYIVLILDIFHNNVFTSSIQSGISSQQWAWPSDYIVGLVTLDSQVLVSSHHLNLALLFPPVRNYNNCFHVVLMNQEADFREIHIACKIYNSYCYLSFSTNRSHCFIMKFSVYLFHGIVVMVTVYT
ncbi:hypothetical protein ACF0H5_013097 [Mactra antiquata]